MRSQVRILLEEEFNMTVWRFIAQSFTIIPPSSSYDLNNVERDVKHQIIIIMMGVVGWCEGAVKFTSLGRPTDIGLQLGKACYPCSG